MTAFKALCRNGIFHEGEYYILSDNRAEAVEYAKSIGIEKIRKVGECPCGCGLGKYKVTYPKPE